MNWKWKERENERSVKRKVVVGWVFWFYRFEKKWKRTEEACPLLELQRSTSPLRGVLHSLLTDVDLLTRDLTFSFSNLFTDYDFFSFPFFSFFQVNSNMDLLKVYPSILIPIFKGVSKLITNIGVLEFGLGPVLSVNISQLLITSRNRNRSSILNQRLTLFFTPILSDSCPN